MSEQRDWRYCGKCHGLFFDGYPNKGRCPAGGDHEAIGYNFVLPHNIPATPTAQGDWEYCVKCQGMFFNGYPDKRRCPADGGAHQHHPDAFRFVLPHNVPVTPTAQGDWEYCVKCQVMFFNGYPDKGRCPADGGGHQHHPDAFRFVLPHPIHPAVYLHEFGDITKATEIFVEGSGFTPDSQVKIFYNYRNGNRLVTNGADNPLVSSTKTDGSFVGVTFSVDRGGYSIGVKVIDNVTSQEAIATLREPV